MSIAAALAELKRSPALFDHIDYLKGVYLEEQGRRLKFVADLAETTKVEFINGHVFLHPAARNHETQIVSLVNALLGNFVSRHQLGKVLMDYWLVQCQRNDYMPDVCFFRAENCAGFDGDVSTIPLPDLIVEVLSPATESNDRELKLRDYARHGISEYWIVDPDTRMLEQYVLSPGATEFKLKARLPEGGRLTSVVVTGFDVTVAALFDAQENQRVLRELLNAG